MSRCLCVGFCLGRAALRAPFAGKAPSLSALDSWSLLSSWEPERSNYRCKTSRSKKVPAARKD